MTESPKSELRGIVKVIRKRVPEYFFTRFLRAPIGYCRRLIIVSPWISEMEEEICSMQKIVQKIYTEEIETSVITRPPLQKYHKKSIDMLKTLRWTDIYYNNKLHAKFYVLLGRKYDFALMASANLTSSGIRGHEIGLFIHGRDWGKKLIDELRDTALIHLKLLSDTLQIKSIRRKCVENTKRSLLFT